MDGTGVKPAKVAKRDVSHSGPSHLGLPRNAAPLATASDPLPVLRPESVVTPRHWPALSEERVRKYMDVFMLNDRVAKQVSRLANPNPAEALASLRLMELHLIVRGRVPARTEQWVRENMDFLLSDKLPSGQLSSVLRALAAAPGVSTALVKDFFEQCVTAHLESWAEARAIGKLTDAEAKAQGLKNTKYKRARNGYGRAYVTEPLCTTMVRVLVRDGNSREALDLLDRMENELKVKARPRTFFAVVGAVGGCEAMHPEDIYDETAGQKGAKPSRPVERTRHWGGKGAERDEDLTAMLPPPPTGPPSMADVDLVLSMFERARKAMYAYTTPEYPSEGNYSLVMRALLAIYDRAEAARTGLVTSSSSSSSSSQKDDADDDDDEEAAGKVSAMEMLRIQVATLGGLDHTVEQLTQDILIPRGFMRALLLRRHTLPTAAGLRAQLEAAEALLDGADAAFAVQTQSGYEATHECVVDPETSCCSHCGTALRSIELDEPQRALLTAQTDRIAREHMGGNDRKLRSWDEFNAFLEKRKGQFDCVVDVANVGFYKQSAGARHFTSSNGLGRFQYQQAAPLVEMLELELGKRCLLIMHERHATRASVRSAADAAILEQWRKAKRLYMAPTGCNDDMFWLRASVVWGVPVVTNDLMRDHHFQMISERSFRRWRERYQAFFDFFRDGPEQGRAYTVHFPPPYSKRVQVDPESGALHIPRLTAVAEAAQEEEEQQQRGDDDDDDDDEHDDQGGRRRTAKKKQHSVAEGQVEATDVFSLQQADLVWDCVRIKQQ